MRKVNTEDLLTIKLDESILPKQIRDIVQVIGLPATLKLVDHYKGTRVYVPERFDPNHALCKLISHEPLIKLIEIYARDYFEVPKCDAAMRLARNTMIASSDKTQRELAIEWDLTERQIRNIQKHTDLGFDEHQEQLF